MHVQGAKMRYTTRDLLSLAAIALTALVLAGCGATTGERAASGAGVGAAAGAGAGAVASAVRIVQTVIERHITVSSRGVGVIAHMHCTHPLAGIMCVEQQLQ